MEEIQNGDIKRKLSEDIHATNPMKMPPAITDYIVPVILTNDDVYYAQEPFCETNEAINDASDAIMNTDSVKDTYITSVSISVIKDATSTSTKSTVTAVIGGVTKTIAAIAGQTLTAQSETLNVTFNPPLKVDRSSLINNTSSTAVANIKCMCTVVGFLRSRG